MKRLAILALGLAACTAQPDEPESTATGELGAVVTNATTTTWWEPGKSGVDDLWPLGQGIASTQVLYKKATPSSSGATFVAFVVWDGNRVGRIFRVQVGPDGASFHNAVQAMAAQRTVGQPGTNSSSGGNTTIGKPSPQPHPNVDGLITFDPSYLNNVVNNAALIKSAYEDFETF